jgi:transcriptional regulator with XRE-family HTH domain
MEFNEKLQKLTTRQNMTQEELSEKLYISRTAGLQILLAVF